MLCSYVFLIFHLSLGLHVAALLILLIAISLFFVGVMITKTRAFYESTISRYPRTGTAGNVFNCRSFRTVKCRHCHNKTRLRILVDSELFMLASSHISVTILLTNSKLAP